VNISKKHLKVSQKQIAVPAEFYSRKFN